MQCLIKNTDTELVITLIDANTDQPIDLTSVAGIVLSVFQKDLEIDKFSLNVQAGFRTIAVTNALAGEITVYLNASNTDLGIVGRPVFYQGKVQFADTNFDSNVREHSTAVTPLASLELNENNDNSFN